ncbi:MAG TPA: leucyl/phenylalanyl-tRNA--protein transferase, partial [Dokdonella sp.]
PRARSPGTWITPAMIAAYERLHALGHAHSIEAWDGDRLAGGIYGVSIGRMFFGESMFSASTNGSKVVLLALCRELAARGHPLLDAQVASDHLSTLGARLMPRAGFCREVSALVEGEGDAASWRLRFPALQARDLAR